jgi:hypothetical protein
LLYPNQYYLLFNIAVELSDHEPARVWLADKTAPISMDPPTKFVPIFIVDVSEIALCVSFINVGIVIEPVNVALSIGAYVVAASDVVRYELILDIG